MHFPATVGGVVVVVIGGRVLIVVVPVAVGVGAPAWSARTRARLRIESVAIVPCAAVRTKQERGLNNQTDANDDNQTATGLKKKDPQSISKLIK